MVEILSIQWARGLLITACLILVYHLQICSSTSCIKESECSCRMDDGSGVIDLSPINSNDPNKPAFANKDGSGNWFWYNPCTAFTNKTCANVAVCQSLNRDYMIGVGNPPPSWTYDSSINRVIATYVGTGNTEVTLICTDSQSVQLKVTSAGVPVKLELSGSRVCAGSGSSDSLTVGSILCITFFVLVCVYLVAGVLFMHFVKRAEGTEKIPNKSMWGELTRLIYEGNIFVFGRFFKRGQYSQK